jgi:XRE family transcriptional regulator, thiamine biosynthesis regulator
MTDYFLPPLRQLVAKSLHREGFSQTKISSLLGVTQASVSHYLSSEGKKSYSLMAVMSVSREDADRYAALLAEEVKRNPADAVETIRIIWFDLLGRGSVCGFHRKMYPSLAQCDVCMKAYGKKAEKQSAVVDEVAQAVKLIESSSSFASAMPEVSVNIACVAGDSEDPSDVVAVPGRIVRVRNTARSLQAPEFGASRHMAKVLLLVRKRRPDFRSCINLRYDSKMNRTLRRLHLRTITVGGYRATTEEDPTVVALARTMHTPQEGFDAIIDSGGNGVEPNVYVFGTGAREVAQQALRIAEVYAAS